MQISSIIPMTSVDCERGFSAMNRIKTKTRNKLSNFVLDHLMRISLSKYSLAGFMEMHGISTVRRFFSMKTRKFDGLTKVEFQKAQAKDTPLGRGSNPGGGAGPPSEIPWIPGGVHPPGSAPKRVTLGPPLGPVAWMWMTYPDRNFDRFFVLTSHQKLQNPPRSYRT